MKTTIGLLFILAFTIFYFYAWHWATKPRYIKEDSEDNHFMKDLNEVEFTINTLVSILSYISFETTSTGGNPYKNIINLQKVFHDKVSFGFQTKLIISADDYKKYCHGSILNQFIVFKLCLLDEYKDALKEIHGKPEFKDIPYDRLSIDHYLDTYCTPNPKFIYNNDESKEKT